MLIPRRQHQPNDKGTVYIIFERLTFHYLTRLTSICHTDDDPSQRHLFDINRQKDNV